MQKNICKNCAFYIAYYKKLGVTFAQLNNGFCLKHQKSATKFESCEEYNIKQKEKEKQIEKRVLSYLEHSLISIIEIAQILKQREDE